MFRRPTTKAILCCLLIMISGCTPVLSSQSLAESDHPYANDIDKKWTVSEPGASEIRLHFKDLQLAKSDGWSTADTVNILDRYGNVVETYGSMTYGVNSQDFWTNWYKGDKLTVELITDKTRPCYGFVVDQKDFKVDENTSAKSNSLAESNHPYANDIDKKWTVSEPGASEIRIHFKDLQLAKSDGWSTADTVNILDRYGNVVETYGSMTYGVNSQDFWTNWYKGDKLTVELITDKTRPCYGFVVDQKDFKIDENSSENVDPKDPKTQPDVPAKGENKVLTTTNLTSSPNPSTLGQSVELIAKVDKRYQFDTSSEGAEEPSGTVNFMDDNTLIGSAKVASRQATLTTSALPVGSHSITAKYIGDINFKSSTSPASTITVSNSIPEQQLSHETSTPSVTPISPTVTLTTQKEETHSFLSSLISLLTSTFGFLNNTFGFIATLFTIICGYIAVKDYLNKK